MECDTTLVHVRSAGEALIYVQKTAAVIPLSPDRPEC